MQSSAMVTLRAITMLACTVAVPLLAVSGTSWSEIVKKFQDCHLPTISDFALASSSSPNSPALSIPSSSATDAPTAPTTANLEAVPSLSVVEPSADSPNTAAASIQFRDIQDRLRDWGATYYVLESWGNDQPLYRFYCKMAVGNSNDYVHCFEATHTDPFQAMLQVLRQVEAWRQAVHVATAKQA
jgi:hypothetical protein